MENVSYNPCVGNTSCENYEVVIVDTAAFKVKITLTESPNVKDPAKCWDGILCVNGTISHKWYGSTCANVAEYGETIVQSLYDGTAKLLGVG